MQCLLMLSEAPGGHHLSWLMSNIEFVSWHATSPAVRRLLTEVATEMFSHTYMLHHELKQALAAASLAVRSCQVISGNITRK